MKSYVFHSNAHPSFSPSLQSPGPSLPRKALPRGVKKKTVPQAALHTGPAGQNERTSTIFFLSFFFLHFENRLRGVSVPSSGGGACLAFRLWMLQWDLLKRQQSGSRLLYSLMPGWSRGWLHVHSARFRSPRFFKMMRWSQETLAPMSSDPSFYPPLTSSPSHKRNSCHHQIKGCKQT